MRFERTVDGGFTHNERTDVIDATAAIEQTMRHESGNKALGRLNSSESHTGGPDF